MNYSQKYLKAKSDKKKAEKLAYLNEVAKFVVLGTIVLIVCFFLAFY